MVSLERVKAALRPPHLLPEGVSWPGVPSKVAAGSLLDRPETTRWARTQEKRTLRRRKPVRSVATGFSFVDLGDPALGFRMSVVFLFSHSLTSAF